MQNKGSDGFSYIVTKTANISLLHTVKFNMMTRQYLCTTIYCQVSLQLMILKGSVIGLISFSKKYSTRANPYLPRNGETHSCIPDR